MPGWQFFASKLLSYWVVQIGKSSGEEKCLDFTQLILVTFSTTPCVQTVKVVYRKKDLKSLVGIAARKIII